MELTKLSLKKLCRDDGLYATPALNDKLYLHYKVLVSTTLVDDVQHLEAVIYQPIIAKV